MRAPFRGLARQRQVAGVPADRHPGIGVEEDDVGRRPRPRVVKRRSLQRPQRRLAAIVRRVARVHAGRGVETHDDVALVAAARQPDGRRRAVPDDLVARHGGTGHLQHLDLGRQLGLILFSLASIPKNQLIFALLGKQL